MCSLCTAIHMLYTLYTQVDSLTKKPKASFGDFFEGLFQLHCIPRFDIFCYFSGSDFLTRLGIISDVVSVAPQQYSRDYKGRK